MVDSLDLEMIRLLLIDGRMPFSVIAKKIGISPSMAQIRFNKLKNAGLILGTTLVLNPEEFGVKYCIIICVKGYEAYVEEIMKYMKTLEKEYSKFMIWRTLGRFNITGRLMSRNLIEVRKIRQSIKEHPHVVEVNISIGSKSLKVYYDGLGLEKELGR